MDGIQLAKTRGVVFGRRKQLWRELLAELRERREQGVLIRTLMGDYRISKASVYRYLKADVAQSEAITRVNVNGRRS